MRKLSRLLAVALSVLVFVVVDANRAEGAATDCDLNPAAYDACMVGVNASTNACYGSGGSQQQCEWVYFQGEMACWLDFCLIIPDTE